MKKIIAFICLFALSALGADSLCYWKASGNSLWRTDANWNAGYAPITLNRIAIHNGDSSNFNDTLKTTATTCGQLQFVNYAGTFTNTAALTISPTANRYSIIITGTPPTWAGNGAVNIQPGTVGTDTLPAITYTGTGTWSIQTLGGTAQTTSLAGNLNIGTATLTIFKNSTGAQTYNGNGFNVKAGTLQIGNANATNALTANFGNGNYDLNVYAASTQTGNQNVNWNNGTINVAGNFAIGSTQTLNSGNNKIILDSSTTTVLTAIDSTRIFYDIEIKKTAAAACSTAGTTSLKCHEYRITSGRSIINCPLICNSYLNLSTDTSIANGSHYIATSFYRASTANNRMDTASNYFTGNVNHDISADTSYQMGRFIIQAGQASILTNVRVKRFALPVASKVTITAGKILRIDSAYTLTGTAGNPDSIIGTASKLRLPKKDTSGYRYIAGVLCDSLMFLDSTARTGGSNANVKSISYFGVTKDKTSDTSGATVTFTSAGFIGGGASINGVAMTDFTVVNYKSATAKVPTLAVGTYAVKVWNDDADTAAVGNFTVTASCGTPSVTSHPSSTTITAPASATFSVTALGDPVLSYQWQRNSSAITGATASSYTTPATTTADNGASFRCMVSNGCGTVTSNGAVLTVNCTKTLQVTPSSSDSLGKAVSFYVPMCGGLTGSTNASAALMGSYSVTSDSTATATTLAHSAPYTATLKIRLTTGDTLTATYNYTKGSGKRRTYWGGFMQGWHW